MEQNSETAPRKPCNLVTAKLEEVRRQNKKQKQQEAAAGPIKKKNKEEGFFDNLVCKNQAGTYWQPP